MVTTNLKWDCAGKQLARSAIYTTTVWWNSYLFNARIGMAITLLKINLTYTLYALKVLINKHQTDDMTRRIEYRWDKEIVHEIIILCNIAHFTDMRKKQVWSCAWKEKYWHVLFTVVVKSSFARRVWRYQRGNQNPYIEEQTTQWPKEKVQKDKQRSTKYTYKTKDRVTWTQLKTGVNSGVPEG